MPLPTSFDAAVDAVYEALTTVTAHQRALAAEDLFLKLAAVRAPGDLAAQVIAQKRVCVAIRDPNEIPGPEAGPSNRLRFACVLELTRAYKSGHTLFSDEMERARRLGTNDTAKVRAALCWPGALSANAAGDPTGIEGGAATAVGRRTTGPVQTGDCLVWVDTYPLSISLEA